MKHPRQYPNMIWVGAAVCVAGLLTAAVALAKQSQIESLAESGIAEFPAAVTDYGDKLEVWAFAPPEDTPGADVLDLDANCTLPVNPAAQGNTLGELGRAIIGPKCRITLVCRASRDPGVVEPFMAEGFPCRLGPDPSGVLRISTDSKVVWTPSGQGTLTCHGEFDESRCE